MDGRSSFWRKLGTSGQAPLGNIGFDPASSRDNGRSDVLEQIPEQEIAQAKEAESRPHRRGSRLSIPVNLTQRFLEGRSPIEEAIGDLQNIDPTWRVEIGVPEDSDGWIRGTDLMHADRGRFNSLLCRIGQRFRTIRRARRSPTARSREGNSQR